MPTPPTIPGYDVLELLGDGGLGSVYRAHHRELGRDVALKVLRERWVDVPAIHARLRREARVLSAVQSPYLVQVLDFGEEPLYLAMELLGGGTLAAVVARSPISRGGCLGPRRTTRLARELFEALGVLHAEELLHRDIKPANVLFRLPGREAVLGDFGLVTDPSETGEGALTSTGVLVGTPGYLPPEVLQGDPWNRRGDLYGLGVTLYVALTGVHPFRERALPVASDPPAASKLVPDCPAALDALLQAMMAPRPFDRPGTAEECRSALAGLEEEEVDGASLCTAPWVRPEVLEQVRETRPTEATGAPAGRGKPATPHGPEAAPDPGATPPAAPPPAPAVLRRVLLGTAVFALSLLLLGWWWNAGPGAAVPLELRVDADGVVVVASVGAPSLVLELPEEGARFRGRPGDDGVEFRLPRFDPGRVLTARLRLGEDGAGRVLSENRLRVPPRVEIRGEEVGASGVTLLLRARPGCRLERRGAPPLDLAPEAEVTLEAGEELRLVFPWGGESRLRVDGDTAPPTTRERRLGIALRRDEQVGEVRGGSDRPQPLATFVREELAAVVVVDSLSGTPEAGWPLPAALQGSGVQVFVAPPPGAPPTPGWFDGLPAEEVEFLWTAHWNLRFSSNLFQASVATVQDSDDLPYPDHLRAWAQAIRQARAGAAFDPMAFTLLPLIPGPAHRKAIPEDLVELVREHRGGVHLAAPFSVGDAVWDAVHRVRRTLYARQITLRPVRAVWAWQHRVTSPESGVPEMAWQRPGSLVQHLVQVRGRTPEAFFLVGRNLLLEPGAGELAPEGRRLLRAADLLAGGSPREARDLVDDIQLPDGASAQGFVQGDRSVLALTGTRDPATARLRPLRAGRVHRLSGDPAASGEAPRIRAGEEGTVELGYLPVFFVEDPVVHLEVVGGDAVEIRRELG